MIRMTLIVAAALTAGWYAPAPAQNSAVRWSSFDMGFGTPSSPTTAVKSAVGIAFAGSSANGATRAESGFLSDTLFYGIIAGVKEHAGLPLVFALRQNYPNPFNPSTTIRYELAKASRLTLRVYDLVGRLVATLVDGEKPAGSYQVELNAGALPTGVYFYRMQTQSFTTTKKLVVMR
jgi:hypothetical protein